MARKPFFSGNYGSALARVDTRPIMEAGRAQGQMFANMGSQVGGLIQQYGLNKEKQGKITDKIENRLKLDPSIAQRLTMTGDEDFDKKNVTDMEKLASGELGLKGLQRLDSAMATINEVDLQKRAEQEREIANQQSLINQKLLNQEFNTKEKLKEVEGKEKAQKDKAFTGLIARADEALGLIESGDLQYDDLNVHTKRLVNDRDLLFNRQVDPNDYAYSTDAEAKAALDALEAKKLAGDIEEQDLQAKKTNLEITEKTKEAAKMPEFTDRASAVKSVKDLPKGVSASFKKFKDGFDVELQYKAEESTDIPSVPGYPNYKKVGGFLYEADPKKKTLRKLDPEDFGEKSELLQNTIKTLTTKDVEQYGLAKFRGVRNDDGDYDVEDPASGETITIPFNQDLENRLIYLDGLRNKLKTQIDLDLTIR
jgi:hypothetical protein